MPTLEQVQKAIDGALGKRNAPTVQKRDASGGQGTAYWFIGPAVAKVAEDRGRSYDPPGVHARLMLTASTERWIARARAVVASNDNVLAREALSADHFGTHAMYTENCPTCEDERKAELAEAFLSGWQAQRFLAAIENVRYYLRSAIEAIDYTEREYRKAPHLIGPFTGSPASKAAEEIIDAVTQHVVNARLGNVSRDAHRTDDAAVEFRAANDIASPEEDSE